MSAWLCSLLLPLNALSLASRVQHLSRLKKEAEVNIFLVFFNLISAQEQLLLCYHFVLEAAKYSGMVKDPSEWMQLFYATAAWWLASYILVVASICYLPTSRIRKGIYLIVEFACMLCLFPSGKYNRPVQIDIWSLLDVLIHTNPAVICVTTYVFIHSVKKSRPGSTSLLSVVGILCQILIHIILPISWARLVRAPLKLFLTASWKGFTVLYQLYGWVLVENAAFAGLHGWFLWMVLRERRAMTMHEKKKLHSDLEVNMVDV